MSCKFCGSSMLGCINCNSSTNCLLCNTIGYYLDLGLCFLNTCNSGFYNQGDGCLACNSTCKTCSGPSGAECLSCGVSSKLVNGICTSNVFNC